MVTAGGSAALAGLYGGQPFSRFGWGPAAALAGGWADGPGDLLRRAPEVSADGLTLRAARGTADIGGGRRLSGFLLNDSLPSPLIRVQRGDRFRVRMENDLPDDLILHWHGLTPPPEHGDGHPRFAVGRHMAYNYDFTVDNRAGTYWYHSHAHHKVAIHTQMGIAGMLIVEDEEERALGLPSGEYEIPLVVQDRHVNNQGIPVYENPNLLAGHMGGEPFGNGINRPYLDVDTALYRFRVLNGANARIFRLERSDARPLVMIGNDGGLLERPLTLPYLDLAPGERADLLVDLRDLAVGEQVILRSGYFVVPDGAEDLLRGAYVQGTPMDLLHLRVARKVEDATRIPEVLSARDGPDPADAVRERRFRFISDREPNSRHIHMRHLINGKLFEMDRIDEHVPFGETEIWTFENDNNFAHPIHLHGTHFRVVSRTGGRNRLMPWEGGIKDTVLVYPSETVSVAVRFTAHRGLYVLHCHNLEHEDVGMMVNVMVE